MDHLFAIDGIIHNNRANVSQSPAVRSQSYTTQKGNQYERQIQMRSFSCHITFIVITKIEARTSQIQI